MSPPSIRTLYDYTHYMENGLGVNPRFVEQLILQATKLGCYCAEYKSFVGLWFDEIQIKSDLVYSKLCWMNGRRTNFGPRFTKITTSD